MRRSTARRCERASGAAAALVVLPVAALLAGCPPATRPPTRRVAHPIGAGELDAGSDAGPNEPPCERASDCRPGSRCVLAPGCEPAGAGRCVEAARCSSDYATFCDCDGASFHASALCPERAFAHAGGCELGAGPADEPVLATRGDATCADTAECDRGRTCVGIEGCATIWTCARGVRCSRDTQAFCGCDGQTFRASMSCPGRPFRRRGACDESAGVVSAAVVDAGAARRLDAGTRAVDAGTRTVDAGAARRLDAGTRAVDAGTRAVDAGAGVTVPTALGPGQCRAAGDCESGELCEGAAGCGAAWRCAPAHPCTRDTQYFCGCDGRTFRASMQCPGRPYAHRGACAP